jgi:hypothetical protein
VPPRRAEADAPFAEPFALGVEVVGEEAEVRAADVLDAAGAGAPGGAWWTPVITGTRFALRSFPRK